MKILITVLLLSLSSLAQTLTVIDDSPSDSPITMKGTVTWDSAGNTTCAIKLHNSASKIVVAWRQDIEATFPNGGYTLGYWRHDHFFKDEAMLAHMSPQPGSDAESYIDCGVFSVPTWTSSTAPNVKIKTYWVQFIDGSRWGDPDAQAYMMAQRNNAVQFLNQLAAAYAHGGEQAFTQTLTSFNPRGINSRATDELNEAHTTQLLLEQMPDVKTQLVEVNRKLSVAASHANWMY
jgi:hypothetical protein